MKYDDFLTWIQAKGFPLVKNNVNEVIVSTIDNYVINYSKMSNKILISNSIRTIYYGYPKDIEVLNIIFDSLNIN